MRYPLHNLCGVPQGANAKWREVNLNEHSVADFYIDRKLPNPLLHANTCERWVNSLARIKGVDYTFGGYMENRKDMWRKHYMKRGHFIHYGIDINVPFSTPIFCPIPYKVIEIFYDEDACGGWGQRVVVKTERGLVVFAHILVNRHLCIGQNYDEFHLIGRVAIPQFNGGWYSHLHIQALAHISLLNGLDGYGKIYKGMYVDYPDPLQILFPFCS